MASTSASASAFPALDSYSTAVVLLPSEDIQHEVNLLRSANDKSFPRWTSHITMLFPFVHPSSLSEATQTLRNAVESANLSSFNLTLDHVDKFSQKSYNTVFLAPSRSESTQVKALWKTISDAAGYKGRAFAPHMTLGQAKSKTELGFLEEKGGRLLANRDRKLSWAVGSLVILRKDDADGGKMKIVDRILLSGAQAQTLAPVTAVSEHPRTYRLLSDATSSGHTSSDVPEGKLRITTFNVLSDELHPPSTRFALLKRDILSRPSDILCLQEVPDSLLPLLWHDPDISAIYTFSTYSADAVMPNLQNIVVLTAAHLPFTWRALPLSDNKHKTAAVLSFSLKGNDDLVIAVVHLTAGHEAPQLATRDVEAVALLSHLQTEHPNADWIVVGDMNLNSSSIPSYWADTLLDGWDLVHSNTSTSSGQDAGYTYDPVHNRLASETVKRTKQPFRYDRICVKAGGRVQVQDVVVLKAQNGSAPASDHWALCAELNLGSADAGSPADIAHVNISTTQETVSSPEVKAADPIGNTTPTAAFKWTQEDEGLEKWARNNGAYPTPEEDAARTRAINTIRTVLGGLGTSDEEQVPLPAGVKLVFEPVGSRMLGADTASSDLDVLCVGNLGQTTFFNLMRTRIRSHTRLCTAARRPATLILRRFVRDAAVPMMRLQVDGVEVDLQYAPAAKVAERWTEVPSLPADDPLFSLPASTLRVLNAHRDMVRILSLLPTDRLPSFRLALRTLKVWASNRGIAGAKFGFLGGMHLTLLLAPIAMSVAHDHSGPVRLIERFFASYEHFNFSDSIVSVSGSATAGSTYRRTPREALAILSVERPIINVSAAASVPSVAVLRREIGRGYSLTHAMHSPSVVCGTPEEGVKEFQGKYPAYAKVDISFWGKDPMRMRALLGYIESKLIKLLLELEKQQGFAPRVWPRAFVEATYEEVAEYDSTVNVKFLVGCNAPVSALAATSVLPDFERLVHQQEYYYDASEAYFGVTAISRDEAQELKVAPKELAWADGGVDNEVDEDDEEPAPDTADEAATNDTLPGGSAIQSSSSAQVRGAKLRTSADVYNRLMWDASINRADHVVGYEDRFVGVMEMPLTNWKREVEDEAFVPFHRVVHFRRVSDGVKVWDRRKRVDMVFGSGGAVNGQTSSS